MIPRRIAFVEFAPSGGLFQFTAQLAGALAAQGHDVHLFTGPRPELSSTEPNLHIHAVLPTWHPGDERPRPPWFRKIRRALRAGQLVLAWFVLLARLLALRPDVVLWSTMRFSIDTIGVLVTSRLLRRTTLGMVSHEPRPMKATDTTSFKTGRLLEPTLKAAWQRMGVAFVLGKEAEQLLRTSWSPRFPVVVIPHGETSALRGDTPVPPVLDTEPVALFFGAWTAYKGLDVLLDAWPAVRTDVPDATLVIAGAVAGVDLDRILERCRATPGIDPRPGYVALDEIPVLFGQARVVVTPYLRASQSGVAHVAHTFERPVVASRVGDIPSVVRDGETGLLVPPADAPALAEAIVALLRDAGRAAELGSAGARAAKAESSWPEVARRFDEGLDLAEVRRSGPA